MYRCVPLHTRMHRAVPIITEKLVSENDSRPSEVEIGNRHRHHPQILTSLSIYRQASGTLLGSNARMLGEVRAQVT